MYSKSPHWYILFRWVQEEQTSDRSFNLIFETTSKFHRFFFNECCHYTYSKNIPLLYSFPMTSRSLDFGLKVRIGFSTSFLIPPLNFTEFFATNSITINIQKKNQLDIFFADDFRFLARNGWSSFPMTSRNPDFELKVRIELLT